MIHIEYEDSKLAFFDDFIEDLRYQARLLLMSGGFMIKDQKYDIDDQCRAFLKWILEGGYLRRLANIHASKIPMVIQLVRRKFPLFGYTRSAMKATNLYKCVYVLFVNYGYEKLSYEHGGDMVDATGSDVCPYCNRIYIKNVITSKLYANDNKRKKSVRGELDHFYTKELYPYLAVCRYNLIPSCKYCNGANGKHTDDAADKGLVNPYLLKQDHSDISFHTKIVNGKVASLKRCAEGIKVTIDCNTPEMANNIQEFNLKELYDTHTDYAAEIFWKVRMRKQKRYLDAVKSRLYSGGYTLSEDDINRLILGNYTQSKDFKKRPLSKFMNDIAREYGLIK